MPIANPSFGSKPSFALPRILQPERYLRASRRWIGRFITSRASINAYLQSHEVKKLHIGGGRNTLSGWLNTDLGPASSEIIYMDATKRYPFDDNVFDYVYSEHMIEHIPYAAARQMLRECYRVLKPGGKIRLATPDLVVLLDLYKKDRTSLQNDYLAWATKSFTPEADQVDPVFVINNFVRDWGHQFIYDEETLRRAMNLEGFTDITRGKISTSEDAALVGLEHVDRMPDGFLDLETMILEAKK